MNETQAIAVREQAIPTAALPFERSVEQVLARVEKVRQIMERVMKPGRHYGIIPGTDKPTLLDPGAELLNTTFMLDPQYDVVDKERDGDHLTAIVRCTLYHIPTGLRVASGMGSCSSKETKYAFRNATRQCPTCGKEAIIKGKEEYGGGWLCWKKKEGCGTKYKDGDKQIEEQTVGKVPNENLADQWNTIVKMACKRSLKDAVLNATAASDIFAQDLENETDAPVAAPTRDKEVPQPSQEHGETPPPPAATGASDWRAEFTAATAKFLPHLAPNTYKRLLGEYGYEREEQIPDRETAVKIYKTLELMVDQKTKEKPKHEGLPV